MRHLFTILLLYIFCTAHATDTLTRAQVYNFSVGDTFDYRDSYTEWNVYNQIPPSPTVVYRRCVIENVYLSMDSMTKFIARRWLYPLPVFRDTLILWNPRAYEVILDTAAFRHFPLDTVIVRSSLPFWGMGTNFVLTNDGLDYISELFAENLGMVQQITSGSGGSGGTEQSDSSTLIYYSGPNGTMGTPYTFFPTSVTDVASSEITVFPNPTKGSIYFKGIDTGTPIEIFDLLGQRIFSTIADRDNFSIDLSGQGKGVYIYKFKDRANMPHQATIVLE